MEWDVYVMRYVELLDKVHMHKADWHMPGKFPCICGSFIAEEFIHEHMFPGNKSFRKNELERIMYLKLGKPGIYLKDMDRNRVNFNEP